MRLEIAFYRSLAGGTRVYPRLVAGSSTPVRLVRSARFGRRDLNHSDDLSVHTLRQLAARNSTVQIFVPAFEHDYCTPLLNRIGLLNVTVTPFGTWTPLDEFTRFMILQDGTGRNDSGILVEYKGHRILNTVDSQISIMAFCLG
jgi:hypothetical protein